MNKVIAIGLTSEKLDELLENMKSKVLASLKRLSEQIVRYYKGAKIGKKYDFRGEGEKGCEDNCCLIILSEPRSLSE